MVQLRKNFLNKFHEFKDLDISFIMVSEEDGCTFHFDAGPSCTIYDGRQSCCEHRWMTCDDDLNEHRGSRLLGAELLDDSCEPGENDYEHDIVFLRIDTTTGSFKLVMHNSHNGCYGGFAPEIRDGS